METVQYFFLFSSVAMKNGLPWLRVYSERAFLMKRWMVVCVGGGGGGLEGGTFLVFKMLESSSFIQLFVNEASFSQTGTQNLIKLFVLAFEDLKMWTLISV